MALASACLVGTPVAAAEGPQPLPDEGLIAVLPPDHPVTGGEPLQLRVLAVEPDGAPMQGLKLKVDASHGSTSGWTTLGPGLYGFEWVPPAVDAPVDVQVTLRGRTPSRQRVSASATLTAMPAPVSPSATARPSSLTLGRADGGTLLFDNAGELLIRSHAGEVMNLTDMGDRKTARFVAPKVNFPHLSLITFADARAPFTAYGEVTVHLQGSVDFPVEAPAGASVMLRVADGEFGPEVMSEEGEGSVSIVVPPGVSQATQVSVVDGEPVESGLDLGIPETRRIALFPLPPVLPADGRVQVPVRALVRTPDGHPDEGAEPRFEVSAGTLGPVRHEGGGIHAATWTLADSEAFDAVEVEVRLDSAIQRDGMKLGTVPPRPARLVLEDRAEGDRSALWVAAERADGTRVPLSDDALVVRAVGAQVEEVVEDDGGHRVTLAPEGDAPVRVSAHVRPPIAGNLLSHVLVLPGTRQLASDGADQTTVVVATVDAFGYPVPGTEVALALQGDGDIVGSVRTDDGGTATVPFTAGTTPGVVRIRASAQGAEGEGWLVATPQPLQLDLPAPGGLAGEWASLVVERTLGEERPAVAEAPGLAAPDVALDRLADADAALDRLELRVEPERVRPGDQVRVQAVARSADGLPIPGQQLDFLTSAGSLREVAEVEGRWSAVLSVPEDAGQEVKVSAVAGDGTMQMVRLAVDPTAPPSVLAKPAASEAQVVRVPRVAPERPWLRGRLSAVGSLYNYEQAPAADPGPLLPRPLVVGGPAGQPATPVGAEFDVRGWLPDLPYLGFHGMLRTTRYAVDAASIGGVARDNLVNLQLDVAGRYPFEIGPDSYWIGARAGFHYNDFMLFTGCLEPGCLVQYEALNLGGLGIGPEMGAEIGKLYLIAGYALGLAGFTNPYSHTVDVHVGWQLTPNAFLDAGFTSLSRRIGVHGAESGLERGRLSDHQAIFTLGGGISL